MICENSDKVVLNKQMILAFSLTFCIILFDPVFSFLLLLLYKKYVLDIILIEVFSFSEIVDISC